MADTTMKANTWMESVPGKVHSVSSGPGKFSFGFMGEGTETPMAKPTHASGTFPIAGGKEEPYAKPTHAPGTLTK